MPLIDRKHHQTPTGLCSEVARTTSAHDDPARKVAHHGIVKRDFAPSCKITFYDILNSLDWVGRSGGIGKNVATKSGKAHFALSPEYYI
jgi:hypothetical protein